MAGTMPTEPITGSTMTAARSSLFSSRMRRAASGSLKGKTTAPSRTPRGRPALPGTGTGRWGSPALAGSTRRADGDGVVGAVVASLGLGEALLAGNGAGGAEGVHGGLGAGIGEADEVEAGDALAE